MKADESQDVALNVQSVTFLWKRMKERRGGVQVLEPLHIQSRKQEVLQKGPAPSIFRKLVLVTR